MTVGIDDALRLFQQVFIDLLSPTQLHPMVWPRGTLRLQVDAHLVGSSESSLWRTIGMEAHVVQTVLLHLREDADPRGFVGRRISRLRETAVLHRAAQEGGTIVDIQLSAHRPHLTDAEGGLVTVGTGEEANPIEFRIKLIP